MKIQDKYTIRIGTRDSPLAIWQAQQVQKELLALGHDSVLIFIKSAGDINQIMPVYEIGVEGVFTKALDSALLENNADIIVHSLKDVPVIPAKGLYQAAVLKRDNPYDLLVYKEDLSFLQNIDYKAIIATGSLRRRAQWLRRFPSHSFVALRGNVNTRLEKLYKNTWNGAIFAAAGLERIGLRPPLSIELDWMIPAPAQGTIAVFCRKKDTRMVEICTLFNHKVTEICTSIERLFLKNLLGGCSNPIGALATIEDNCIHFKGNILSRDGQEELRIEKKYIVKDLDKQCQDISITCANEIKINPTFSTIIK